MDAKTTGEMLLRNRIQSLKVSSYRLHAISEEEKYL